MTDDEQRIRHRSSFGCHIADSNMAPEMCVKEMKEGGYRGLTYCGRRQCQALSPSDDDAWSSLLRLGFVVDGGGWEQGCGLLIAPKLNIGVCRWFADVQFGRNQAKAYLANAELLYFNGSMA